MNPLFGFVFLFLTIQNILTMIEFPWYLGDFISDVEGGRTQMVQTGIFTYNFLKAASNYILFYVFSLLSLYYLVLQKRGTAIEGFLLGATICASAATGILAMFSRSKFSHIPVLLYDIFITGGIGFGVSVFIWNNYKSILSTYYLLFFFLFAITAVLYNYVVYKIEITPYKKDESRVE